MTEKNNIVTDKDLQRKKKTRKIEIRTLNIGVRAGGGGREGLQTPPPALPPGAQ